jgi:TatD DNase family protein
VKYINLHTHQFTNRPDVLEVVNQYPQEFNPEIPYYSLGIHPWHILEERIDIYLQIIESKVNLQSCLAVGECGLDKRIEIPFDLQMSVLEKQLLLAEKHQKPVIIHCVAAFQELIAIKKRLNIQIPMVIHGFSKSSETAQQLLNNGFYLSFGKYLLRNPELEQVFIGVPNDRIFLETDTVAEDITAVYDLAAKYLNCQTVELQEQIVKNFKTVFSSNINL